MIKNTLNLVIFSLFIFCSSCSTNEDPIVAGTTSPIEEETPIEDETPIDDETYLIRRIETTTNGVTITKEFNYIGNRLFNCTGASYYYGSGYNDYNVFFTTPTGLQIYTYIYEGDQLIYLQVGNSPNDRKRTYFTHNGDGTVDYIQKKVYYAGVDHSYEVTLGIGKYTFENSNLVKHEFTCDEYNEVSIYTYDTKFKPTKNILEFDKFLDNGVFSTNNIISIYNIKNYTSAGGIQNQTIKTTYYTYTYNTNDFPSSATRTESDNGIDVVSSINYFY
ncbi:hypothetical protein [Flavobacterium caeni]|uniref:hypothetical protein n=1 Tax=Flavobacterium caeni TaxID=490189 RepID=UPI0011130B9D|nr:hypothetical protein [Flavobacterium caeni]